MSFRLCCYNIGIYDFEHNDFARLCKYNNTPEVAENMQNYINAQKESTKLISDKAQVYCLQEVGYEEDRPFITELKKRNFEIIYSAYNGSYDTAIALDKSRFSKIKNHSMRIALPSSKNPGTKFYKDVAIATAYDNVTKQEVVFVSAHAPGFDFTKPVGESEGRDGDLYCQAIAAKLDEIGKGKLALIGADMNANPEKWDHRFKIFTDKGFEISRTNQKTNVNPEDSTDKEREIDFFITKISNIGNFFKSTIFIDRIESTTFTLSSIGFDCRKNGSDHIPIFTEIKIYETPSGFSLLCASVYAFFSSFFKKKNPHLA